MYPQRKTASNNPKGRPSVCYQIGGGSLTGKQRWEAPMKPIKLQRIIAELGLTAQDVAENITNKKGRTLSRSTISSVLNRGIIPEASTPDFKAQVEAYLHKLGVDNDTIKTCWKHEDKSNVVSFGRGIGKKGKGILKPAPVKTEEELFFETLKEAEVLTPTTMQRFKLFRHPFIDDVRSNDDVFMSESHQYSIAAMKDAAEHGGMVAIVGECGAGKTVLRKKLIDDLSSDNHIRIIFPQTIDKGRLTANLILEAIVNDLSPGVSVKRGVEAKARQVRELLLASAQAGMKHVLILEEAHDLTVPMMKQLKRLWEIEDGYNKVLGIILVGQPELGHRLNIQNHPEMREMILRCLISELLPIHNELEAYVTLKFQRVGTDIRDVLADGWADAVRKRLTMQGGRSRLYPLYIHNLLAAAMNEAAQMGESIVTAEIIEGV